MRQNSSEVTLLSRRSCQILYFAFISIPVEMLKNNSESFRMKFPASLFISKWKNTQTFAIYEKRKESFANNRKPFTIRSSTFASLPPTQRAATEYLWLFHNDIFSPLSVSSTSSPLLWRILCIFKVNVCDGGAGWVLRNRKQWIS